jgi:hypothetical protein
VSQLIPLLVVLGNSDNSNSRSCALSLLQKLLPYNLKGNKMEDFEGVEDYEIISIFELPLFKVRPLLAKQAE